MLANTVDVSVFQASEGIVAVGSKNEKSMIDVIERLVGGVQVVPREPRNPSYESGTSPNQLSKTKSPDKTGGNSSKD